MVENKKRDELDPYKFNRPRGVLTEADRKYLCGESEIEEKSHGERRARERIRKRVTHALLDFDILLGQLEERDADLIVTQGGEEPSAPVLTETKHAIGFIFFLYLKRNVAWFREDVVGGIEQAWWRHGWLVDAECDLTWEKKEEVDDIPEERVKENLGQVSREQLRDMLLAGVISDEKFSAEIQRRQAEDESDDVDE